MRIGAFLMLLAVTSCATPGSGTMHPSTPARSSGAATISLVSVRMVSRLVGWGLAGPSAGGAALAIGTTVVRTADGGRHWATVLRADGVVTADFHDSARAWVLLVIGSESTASRESVVVASTADAGATWQRTARLGVDGVATRIQFVDTSHGWVFAQPSAGGAVGAQDTTVYRTVDGGQRWQAVKPASQVRQNPDIRGTLPEACAGGGPISEPVFLDAQTGWLGGFCDRVFLYATRDGGLSWAPQNLPAFPGPASTVSPAAYLQYGVGFLSHPSTNEFVAFVHRGITTGANGLQDSAMYKSRDLGASWNAVRLPAALLAADFIDSEHGWMIGLGPDGELGHLSLYATVDDGQSWRLRSGQVDYLFTRELNFVDETTGFISSGPVKDKPGFLARTTDSGATWQPLSTTIN